MERDRTGWVYWCQGTSFDEESGKEKEAKMVGISKKG
jgi:hypothetical protein